MVVWGHHCGLPRERSGRFSGKLQGETCEFARAAADVSARLGVRGADAFYIALAKECGDVLYTFDEEQKKRCTDEVETFAP